MFLTKRLKIEKVANFFANLNGKNKYVIRIRNLKQVLNHGLVLKNVHRIINFNQRSG